VQTVPEQPLEIPSQAERDEIGLSKVITRFHVEVEMGAVNLKDPS
jgi:hypothetical protein